MQIEKIYSKINPDKLLHIFASTHMDEESQRVGLVDPTELIQVALLQLPQGKTFPAHQHLPTERVTIGTQETWIIVYGNVMVYYYDTNGEYLCERMLAGGDCTITLAGGHTYKAITKALVYEVKNGPYLGIEKDKEFI